MWTKIHGLISLCIFSFDVESSKILDEIVGEMSLRLNIVNL